MYISDFKGEAHTVDHLLLLQSLYPLLVILHMAVES